MTFPPLFAAGYPGELPAPDVEVGPCELCGHHGERVGWRAKANWTAFSTHAYPGVGAVCQGCALLVEGGPTVNERGRVLRWTLYSLATDGAGSVWALKDGKREIRGWLDRGMSVSVADGGKKHVAYLAPVAVAGRVVCAIDGERVDVSVADWAELAAKVEGCYRAGAAKRVLVTGRLDHRAVRAVGFATAAGARRVLARWAGSAELRLAVWLAQHDDEEG